MDGTEEELYGDSGYLGAEKREEAILTNGHGKEIQYIICARPSSLKKRYAGAEYEKAVAAEHAKASIRCCQRHVPFPKNTIDTDNGDIMFLGNFIYTPQVKGRLHKEVFLWQR